MCCSRLFSVFQWLIAHPSCCHCQKSHKTVQFIILEYGFIWRNAYYQQEWTPTSVLLKLYSTDIKLIDKMNVWEETAKRSTDSYEGIWSHTQNNVYRKWSVFLCIHKDFCCVWDNYQVIQYAFIAQYNDLHPLLSDHLYMPVIV